jgi:hypothetical protein
MTLTPRNTQSRHVVFGAVIGAAALNVVTVVWAFFASSSTSAIVAAAVGITFLGLALGGAIGWGTGSMHWAAWWAEGRHTRGAIRGQGHDRTAR